jgi:hypothetical protein
MDPDVFKTQVKPVGILGRVQAKDFFYDGDLFVWCEVVIDPIQVLKM